MSLLLVDHASPYADAPMSLWLKLIEIILLSEGSVSIASHFQSFFILFAFPIPGPKLSQIPALSSLAETRVAEIDGPCVFSETGTIEETGTSVVIKVPSENLMVISPPSNLPDSTWP